MAGDRNNHIQEDVAIIPADTLGPNFYWSF